MKNNPNEQPNLYNDLMTNDQLTPYLNTFHLPLPDSHKGQNGKVMVIGGSELFHAASQWSLLVVSRIVDMVFYSSIPSNNALIKEAKAHFPNGIVIPRDHVEDYIQEASVILLGPGMERSDETEKIANDLLSKYPDKKWVIDAGALQMVNPSLLHYPIIVTPHHKEFEMLISHITNRSSDETEPSIVSQDLHDTVVLLKGQVDEVVTGETREMISGGNVGMTKGGTGDVLAGLVAGLYAFTDDPFAAAIVASYVNKKTGEDLYTTVGPFFNATDLANQIPKTLNEIFFSNLG